MTSISNGNRAVLFDMGGTLEDVYYDDALRLQATRGLQALLACHGLDPRMDTPTLYARVSSGLKAYQKWREETEVELPSTQVWTEYVFTDSILPPAKVREIAEELSFFHDTHYYRRKMRPEAPAALKALADRGYRLGVISNVLSLGQVNHNLQLYGLASRFDAIVTSSGLGTRKPNPRIFWEAARLIGLPPEACAYVGDTISRDVIGSRRAGYALAIQIRSFLTKVADGDSQTESPDFAVDSLLQVLDAVDHTVWQAAT